MAALAVEQVVTTTYRVVCSDHGEIARSLNFKEAHEARCHKCAKPTPHDCTTCGTSDDKCNELVRTKGRACCGTCHRIDTHGALVGGK